MTSGAAEPQLRIYERELREFLPPRIFDAHVHLFDRSCLPPGFAFPPRSCFSRFGGQFTLEQYREWTDAFLPDQEVHLNSFGDPLPEADRDAAAAYTGRVSDNQRRFGMALVSPRDSAEAVLRRVRENRLVGYKPYLRYVDWKKPDDVTVFDLLAPEHLQAADRNGFVITLHIPRQQRLADPLKQTQMVDLCRRHPGARVVFAHIGRAYYLSNVSGFLDGIAACPNAYLDTAMVNHEGVLEHAFRNFPLDRILFGSDAPIAMLPGKSVEINNQYAYLMGEDYEIGTSIFDSRHAVAFTSFFYEQIRGIRLAAERAGLSRRHVEGIFFHNASRLFREAAARNADPQKD